MNRPAFPPFTAETAAQKVRMAKDTSSTRERHLSNDPHLAFAACWYWARKLQARFLAGDYAAAVDASLAARFHAARAFEAIGNAYLREARSCYRRWGADGKVRQLETLYPFLREPESAHAAAATIAAPTEHLDLATVVKASQAVSGNMAPERLIEALMRLAIEHAGAERGLLLLSRGNEPRPEVEAIVSGEAIVVRRRGESAAAFPDSIVHHAMQTREIVILDDAAAHPTFSADPYVRERNARSILCLPLVNESKMTGVLYLESNLTPRVFTPDWIAALKLLALQAAISLENTYLHGDLEEAARESERRYREIQMELAHASRVATMGQLSASIAHEVSQPIAGAVTNAHAALRLLEAEPQNVDRIRRALARIVRDGNRAGEVVDRVRALVKKAPPRKDTVDVNEAILDVVRLTQGEAAKHGIAVRTQLASNLPLIEGDRVQLQQVVLNLVMNAVEAMSAGAEGSRHLLIGTARTASDAALVAVEDSGPGVDPEHLDRIFSSFYTTKPSGLGMGLSICRTIVEAHGGRLWATSEPEGALFQLTLPTRIDKPS